MPIAEQKRSLKLIELVKAHAVLYNEKRCSNQVTERRVLWEQIAIDMNQMSGMKRGE